MYGRDDNVFFPGTETLKGRLDQVKAWCVQRETPAARRAALSGYYFAKTLLIVGLVITFLLCFFFVLLISVPAYAILRLIRVPPRLAFLLGNTLAAAGIIYFCYSDTDKHTLGAWTNVWLALMAAVLATEWVHFLTGAPITRSHPPTATA